jgi:antitoxin component of MazEF toxin-antitoxin module
MRVQVQKWGDILALRIPKPFAEEAKVRQGTVVNLSLEEGRLVASLITDRPFSRFTV